MSAQIKNFSNYNIIKIIIEKTWLLFLFVCLFLIFEYVFLGPFSYYRVHDSGDSAVPAMVGISKYFWEFGNYYWLNQEGLGIDRLANLMYLSNIMGLLYMVLPGWVTAQILIFLQTYVSSYFTYRICREKLGLGRGESSLAGVSLAFYLINNGHCDGFGILTGIFFLPLVFWLIEIINLWNPRVKYLSGLLFGFIFSFLFMDPAMSLPFIIPITLIWFIFIRRIMDKSFILLLGLIYIGMIFPQIKNFQALWLHQSLSHRADWPLLLRDSSLSWKASLADMLGLMKTDLPEYFIILPIFLWGKIKDRNASIIFVLWILTATLSFVMTPLLITILDKLFNFKIGFNFGRFVLMKPFLTSILIGHCFKFILQKESLFWNRSVSEKFIKIKRSSALIGIFLLVLIFVNVLKKYKSLDTWITMGSYFSNMESPIAKKMVQDTKEEMKLAPFRSEAIAMFFQPSYLQSYGLEIAGGYINMYPQHYQDLWSKVIEPIFKFRPDLDEYFNNWGNRVNLFSPWLNEIDDFDKYYRLNLLSLLNVKYIFSEIPITHKSLSLKYHPTKNKVRFSRIIRNFKGNSSLFIYENLEVLPRFFLTRNFKVFKNDKELLTAMAETPAAQFKENAFVTESHYQEIIQDNYYPYVQGQINLNQYSPDKIHLTSIVDGDALLVVSNGHSPFWECHINKIKMKIFKVNNSLWGIRLKRGKSLIEFSYRPPYISSAL